VLGNNYCPEFLAVWTECIEVCTKTTEGQYSKVRLKQSRLISSLLYAVYLWEVGGLMVSALDPRASGLGLSPGWGHCVVFLGKTLYSLSASLHTGV